MLFWEVADTTELMGSLPASVAGVARVIRRWFSKILLSLVDQGLASGGHFVLNILLMRCLLPSEYGAFAVTFSVFLLAANLYSALILEPLGVIGPAYYGECLPAYFLMTLWIHGGLSLILSAVLLLLAAGLAAMKSALAPAMAALSFSAPCMLLFWLFRRACYLDTRPGVAVKGSLFYVLALGAGLVLLWRQGGVSPPRMFLVMGAASIGVSVLLWHQLGQGVPIVSPWQALLDSAEAARRHWTYARWSLGTTILYWFASSLYLPAVGALAGLREVAAYRAAENLLLPMSQVLTALGLLLLPRVTARGRILGRGYLDRTAVRVSILCSLAAGVFALAVTAGGPMLIRLLYGGESYLGSLTLVPFLGLALVLRAIGDTGFGIASRAAERPDIGFWSTVIAAAMTLGCGLVLVSRYGAAGAAAGWMFSSAASCAVTVYLFRRRLR